MISRLSAFISDIPRNFGVADALDILLVAILLYSLLIWFKATASRRVLIGLIVLTAVYLLARAFDMYLTSLMFQAGFAVLIIVVVVVFQEDLRRMLESVTHWRLINLFRTVESRSLNIDALVETVFSMAAQRTGALIVLGGAEPVARHVDGGVALNGEISKPLLLSIFDPSSPGHDGAVLIQRGKIESFAVHLPISKNQAEIAGRGTRHSAALGLSEVCDALVITVSEERGAVSVAESGRLTEVRSAAALKGRIARFDEETGPHTVAATPWRALIARDWHLKSAAFALAVAAWFSLAYNPDTVQRTFVVPIQYRNLPASLVLDAAAPHEVRLTLSGSEHDFQFLDPGTLRASIDLGHAQVGRMEFDVTDDNIRLPVDLSVYGVDPSVIRLNFTPATATPTAEGNKTTKN